MRCDQIEEVLSAFADGEASAGERRLVAGHVADCRECARKLRLMSGMKASVKKLGVPPAPAELKARLRRSAAGRRKAAWPGLFTLPAVRWGLASAFAAASLIVILRVRNADDNVSVELLLAAHTQYALTMPLSPSESLYAGLAERTAEGDAHGL